MITKWFPTGAYKFLKSRKFAVLREYSATTKKYNPVHNLLCILIKDPINYITINHLLFNLGISSTQTCSDYKEENTLIQELVSPDYT